MHLEPRAKALLVVEADGGGGARHFSYVDRMTPNLRPYDLTATPVAALAAELYPLAGTSSPELRGLGLVGDYRRAIGLTSSDSSGAQVGTSWQAYDVGVRERIRLGSSVLVGLGVSYGADSFHFDEPSFSAELPSVDYSFLRGSLDARVFFGAFSVLAGGSYLDVLQAGSMAAMFPRASVGGVDGRLACAYRLTSHFEVSGSVTYTRYFYSFHPQPGDANVAGGAPSTRG